ncbi:MAG TPA: hypothetical protein VK796_02045 [Cytophaga sp.]|nr:hypothetical protein [Cytophaga sp.]
MKKIFLVLVTVSLFSFDRQHADDGFAFTTQLLPEKKYDQTIEQTSMAELTYIASKEFLQKLKAKGIENPTITNTNSVTESVVKTGQLNSDDRFPVTMEFVKTTSSDGKKTIPDGAIVYGHATTKTLPQFDSIVSDGLDAKMKSTILKTLESTFAQMALPERKVKVGESFSIKTPLALPIAGMNVEMDITTKYKLISVKNGMADFDITQVYTMKLNYSKYEIKGKGTGDGKLVYDIENSYNKKYSVNIDMTMGVKLDDFAIALKMKSGLIQAVVISPNKK